MIKERPILFSGQMVRALLEGRKTQTRRAIKLKPFDSVEDIEDDRFWPYTDDGCDDSKPIQCPYGSIGAPLWVREAVWYTEGATDRAQCHYRATSKSPEAQHADQYSLWRPSIHMPRWASRIMLEIADIRVERVQDISEDDAMAEGIGPTGAGCYRMKFKRLWDGINAAKGHGWDANPWVWVVEFKVLEANS